MDLGFILLALALLLLVVFIVARPLVEAHEAQESDRSMADGLADERERILTALRDLDFDHLTGKISDEDYAPQRAALMDQGVAVLKLMDALQPEKQFELDDEIERAVAAHRRSRPAARRPAVGAAAEARRATITTPAACPECGAHAQPGDRFCARCGTKLDSQVAAAQPHDPGRKDD